VNVWLRMEVTGWERLPEPPVLLVGIHASGTVPIDAYAFAWKWFRHFRKSRPLRGTAHDFLMATPLFGDYLRKIGVVPASKESIGAALEKGEDVILYPGGDLDALRPWTKRDQVVFGGRRGFVKQAIHSGVPIVPVAQVGGPDTMPVITDGRRIAKAFRLDKLLRSNVFPIAVGVPFGVAPGMIPQFPLPAKLRTEILDPIQVRGSADNDAYVTRKAREVEDAIQKGVDRLAKKRRFPFLG
jgi:1-acyl-sn-glycerol-3-phosphate acyltransferase